MMVELLRVGMVLSACKLGEEVDARRMSSSVGEGKKGKGWLTVARFRENSPSLPVYLSPVCCELVAWKKAEGE